MAGIWDKIGGLAGASTIAGTGLNLAKGIFGLAQTARAGKDIKSLMANQVQYKRPEEYQQELAMRKEMAAQQRLPGQGYIEQNIGQAGASALSAAERGAISSNVYQKSVGDILQKQLDAFSNLGLQAAQWQQANKEALMGTMQRGAGYSDQEWQVNKQQPWDIRMNEAVSRRQAGMGNLFGGIEGAIGGLQDYAGTRYYQDVLNALRGGGGAAQPAIGGNQSKPLGYIPDGNLLKYIR